MEVIWLQAKIEARPWQLGSKDCCMTNRMSNFYRKQDVKFLQETGCQIFTGNRMSNFYRKQDVKFLQETGCQIFTGNRMSNFYRKQDVKFLQETGCQIFTAAQSLFFCNSYY